MHTREAPQADPAFQLKREFASINLNGCLHLATSPSPLPRSASPAGALAREHSESYEVCEDDPTDWCSIRDGTPGQATPRQWRYGPMTPPKSTK